MAKIKNDPARYVTRSSLSGRCAAASSEKEAPATRRAARDFRDAHIDDGLYVDFRIKDHREKA